ncbi:GNAT domain [Lasallia pustulata]|uniref:GNAT domain n=1 Tax=Lasallia pustulata TaxID=136370 RepID=A0A1W5DDC8_9LECA|nr:GNAT domain [Lasallia pustulata]
MALCFPGSQSAAGRAAQHANFFRSDRSVRFVKATDTRTGSIVAWARWNFYVDGATLDQTPWPKEWAEGTNVPCVEYFFGALDRKRDAFMKGKDFFLMGVLVTLPEYQGKGIGSSLLQWGLEIADEKGVECWIDASPMSVELYKRLGWVEVDHVDLDLGKYGGEQGIVDRTVCLIRKPGGGEWKVEGGTYYS